MIRPVRFCRRVAMLCLGLCVMAGAKDESSAVTDLYSAARTGDTALCERLLAADPSLVSSEDPFIGTPLHVAVANGHLEAARLFVDWKFDVNARVLEGDTALCLAVRSGNSELVRLLVGKGADLNLRGESGRSALHYAVFRTDTKIAQILIDAKANLNAVCRRGLTPLQTWAQCRPANRALHRSRLRCQRSF